MLGTASAGPAVATANTTAPASHIVTLLRNHRATDLVHLLSPVSPRYRPVRPVADQSSKPAVFI
ncbi:hypothetical protein I545_2654 [Mycobacterium kansasii 662]|uniref:Uncharacterized protein n=2 Tax=Mycobacterium kansasii TaxID=1768 RepID=A0A1V3WMY9_MYCKA|nr:hypothetical protein I545_2654 [Mycobacterium kansasii 662]OOK68305.1 hypothetical protein BZL29_6969 [Mycobacterium kansasii]OOK72166.1 hypothetical protein BZL30_5489 [Mycobacterium kansasii]